MTADRPGKSELALVAGLLLLLVLSVTVAPGREGDLELFFGRFHPALVHLPIGVLLFAVLLEGILRSSRFGAGGHAVAAVLLVGAWSAILAAVAGLYLAQGGGYVASTLLWHRRLGIGIAVVAVTAYVFKKRALRQATEQPGYVFLLSLACIGVVVGGHLGGELTRGEGYLTRYMPDGVRTIAGLPPKAAIGQLSIERPEEATVYSALIEPVFAERCATCHNGIELRGGLRLDAPEGILEGGQSGEVLVAGRAEASELIRRMWLPIEHDDHMPPEDRPQPSVAQAELIRWWIDRGASFDAKLSEAETTPIVQAIFDGYGLDEIRTGIFALDVAPPAAGAVEALRALGAAVSELGEDEPFREVRCVVEACTARSSPPPWSRWRNKSPGSTWAIRQSTTPA